MKSCWWIMALSTVCETRPLDWAVGRFRHINIYRGYTILYYRGDIWEDIWGYRKRTRKLLFRVKGLGFGV